MAAARYVLCDVFAEAPFTGNPLAVFVDGDKVPASLMQAIARELNLSETVFVCAARAGGDARLRIFTPRRELPFAGHPTLGSAAVIARRRRCTTLMLETGVGPIRTSIDEPPDGRRQLVWMEQPLPQCSAYERTDELLEALGLDEALFPVEVYDNGIPHIYVGVNSPARLARLAPDFSQLAAVSPAVGVSCFVAEGSSHWKVRMFAPGHGVAEDAATGSAAGPLAAMLIERGLAAPGEELTLSQGAEIGRPSTLFVRTTACSGRIEQIAVGGGVLLVGQGTLDL